MVNIRMTLPRIPSEWGEGIFWVRLGSWEPSSAVGNQLQLFRARLDSEARLVS